MLLHHGLLYSNYSNLTIVIDMFGSSWSEYCIFSTDKAHEKTQAGVPRHFQHIYKLKKTPRVIDLSFDRLLRKYIQRFYEQNNCYIHVDFYSI